MIKLPHLIQSMIFLLVMMNARGQIGIRKVEPVGFDRVEINDDFWKPRIVSVSKVTLPVCIEQTQYKTGRIRNFEKVAAGKGEKHEGIYYDDSDVYKALEAMAYSLQNNPDPVLKAKAEEWIGKIAAAQLPDGYLNTYYTLGDLSQRWTDMDKHEDYCAGHLIEAAVAWYNATGERKLLDVAIRFANHIDSVFRQQNRHWVSGHEEIELALVKLYKTTQNKRYLDLANWYIEQRGHGYFSEKRGGRDYCQDALPVRDQIRITGHAVRAMYLYTGVADVGAAENDPGYLNAMDQVWQDVVYRNMYITGGIGSSGRNEGFSRDYDLPNEQAYCETCASVGMVLWNQRMNLLTGESKYIDVLERSLYNGALDGLSLKGDRFFYGNPLASEGGYSRSEWFGTACCPSNIARLTESVGNYIYASSDDEIWINLFIGSTGVIPLNRQKIKIKQETRYPWDGEVRITVNPEKTARFRVAVRIPGWAVDRPVPGDTYRYLEKAPDSVSFSVNGKPVSCTMEKGYAVIERNWKKGDYLELNLPMTVRRIVATDEVEADRNRVALQRGPLVYCFEHVDNGGQVGNIVIPDGTRFTAEFKPGVLNGLVVVSGKASAVIPSADGSSATTVTREVTAIPYYSWANRGEGQMQVWMPRKIAAVKLVSY